MSDSSPTPPISQHRLLEARRLGYTPRSSELTSGVVLLTAAWVGHVCLPPLGLALQELAASSFRGTELTAWGVALEFRPAVIRVGQEVLRIGAACWAAALVADLAQVGFVWNPGTLLPHEERISPASGLARMFSWPTLERASLLSLKAVLSIVAVVVLAEFALRSTFAGFGISEGESSIYWGMGTSWICSVLAVAGGGCLLSGVVDAWIRQSRWRLSVEQTEDERRRGG